MLLDQKLQYSEVLEQLAEVIDITPSQHEAAVERYQAVGRWLSKEDSPLAAYNPQIYPQGSFRLGTVIKPLTGEDQYDIDLVCQLESTVEDHTQEQIKQMVGKRLEDNGDYERMMDKEGRRCWTLIYAESTRFHMDILPSIPDDYLWLTGANVPLPLAENAICITDKEDPNYKVRSRSWTKSNPKGYADWFKEQMKVQLNEQRRLFAEKFRMSIEEVQDYKIKTPLQRAVQLLKRHRDISFGDDVDRPISIIITTLAAKSYAEQDNIYDALIGILDKMPDHIETRRFGDKEVKWVENPVNPQENFADKWEESHRKEENFYKWMEEAKKDITEAFRETGLDRIGERLKAPFGKKVMMEAMNRYGQRLKGKRENGTLFMASGTGMLGSVGEIKVENHTFYGS